MKPTSRLVVFFLAAAFPLALFFLSRQSPVASPQNNVPRGTLVEQKKKSVQERYRFYEERERFEFDQLKDPRTGKIPRNIRQQELEFARRQPVRPESDNPLIGNVYTALGPNNLGGRTRAIAYDKITPTIMLAGGISSGIFRTTNSGTTWTNVTPSGHIHNVSSIAQDPRTGSTTTWYYSTGEPLGNSASETGGSYRGHGIYKSVDNGLTWSLLGATVGTLEDFDSPFDYVSKIVVDPTNGNVYAAAQRVIMRSLDGGTTWAPVLGEVGGSTSTGITDIVVSSTGRFYAAFAGTAGTNSGGGLPASAAMDGVWTSTTGASGSWTKIAGSGSATTPTGWNAAGAYGRVVLALAPSNEDVLYILYNNFFSSSCAGTPGVEADFFKWTQSTTSGVDRTANLPDEPGCLDGNDPFAIQGGYDLVVAVKPDDENFVVIGGTNAYRSTNGFATTGLTTRIGGYASAATYAKYATHHPDIHALVFHPTTFTTMVTGDDGGIHRTADITAGTVAWTSLNNDYVTYQYYHVALDPTLGSLVAIGGTQDNGTTHTTGTTTHTEVFGGDGVSVGISATNTWHYLGFQLGGIYRRDPTDPPGFATNIKPTGSGSGIFVTYFYLNPDNTEHLYYASSDALYRTTSASTVAPGTWTLMTNFAPTLTGNIRALATSRQAYTTSHKLYIGTSDGKIYRINDPANAPAATVPTDITGGTMPAGANVSGIAVDPEDDKKVMVTFSNYGVTSIWYTSDASVATPVWTAVEGTLTLPSVRACLIVNRLGFPTEYYVGTSVGLYATAALSGGTTTWTQEGPGTIRLSVVRSFAFRYTDNRMLIGTHGNGMFYTDVPNPLPVQLASFTARVVNNNSVRLDWRTLSEINNYGFFVQRRRAESVEQFVDLPNSFVAGHGTTNEPHDYSFVDANVPSGVWQYRLRQVDLDGSIHHTEPVSVSVLTSVAENSVPTTYALHQNYPNPFNPSTTIQFDLPRESHVRLSVYNSAGQQVATLVNERRAAGVHRAAFSAANLASGMYLYRLEAENFMQTRTLLLVR